MTGVTAHHLRVQGGRGLKGMGRMIGSATSWTASKVKQAARERQLRAEKRRAEKAIEKITQPLSPAPEPSLPPVPKKKRALPRLRRPKQPKPERALPPLVVLETGPGLPPALRLADAVEQRGGALVAVDSVEQIFGDRDFKSVRTIIMARPRPIAEWPAAFQSVRNRAKGRVIFAVVAIAPSGSIARDFRDDNFVLPSPLTPESLATALDSAGWQLPD
jgi:hypothetical protein